MQEQKKTSFYSIFLDISGSVGCSVNYWETVGEIFSMYANEIDKYYFWDTSIEVVDKKQFHEAIQSKKGRGGTSPYVVAQECVASNIENIILITDGQVDDYDVQSCDRILENYKLKKSICYIISSISCHNEYDNTNMSVTCPFTRDCQNKVFKKLYGKPLETIVQYTPEDYKILASLDTITLQNFEADYDKIEGLIIALNMGKQSNIPLKNDLVQMKNRLIKQLAKQKGQQKKDLSDVVREHLQKNDFNSAMEEMRKTAEAYLADNMTTGLQVKIAHLISLCGDLRGQYDLNQIKSNKMATAKNAKKGQIQQDVQIIDLSKNPIECPLLNDEDVPQILIDECEPLLVGVEKCIVDDITTCPLRLLNYPDLKAKLKARLSNYVGVMGIKVHFNKDLLKNPFTQNRLLGGIPLGTHKSHIKVGNYTIAKLFSGGKILGNMNLYYALIWYIINEGSVEYLKDIEKNATQHLVYRLKNSRTYASMCGKSQFVSTEVSTDIALWYCVNSGYLNQPTNRDTFRFHFYNIQYMKKIVEILGYPIHQGFDSHFNRTKTLFGFLSRAKSFTTESQRKTFKNSLIGLYQNGIFIESTKIHKKLTEKQVCVTFVPVDGPAKQEQIQKNRNLFTKAFIYTEKLTNEELYYLGNIIDTKKNPSDYFLDYNLVVPALPNHEVDWKYGLEKHDRAIKVCPKTLRAQKYVQNLEKNERFKEYKYFESYIFKYHLKPTYDEFILFLYNRYIESGKTKTLPFLTEEWTRQLIENYQQFFQKMKVKEIIKIWNDSRDKQNLSKVDQKE